MPPPKPLVMQILINRFYIVAEKMDFVCFLHLGSCSPPWGRNGAIQKTKNEAVGLFLMGGLSLTRLQVSNLLSDTSDKTRQSDEEIFRIVLGDWYL